MVCKRNQANIDKLANTKANDFRFIGLSLAEAGLEEYVEGYHLKFPVYAGLTTETVQSLGLGGTPQPSQANRVRQGFLRP